MTATIERRRIIPWLAALIALPMLAACESGEMFGQRRPEGDDDDQGSGGGMSGDSGGGTGGGGGY